MLSWSLSLSAMAPCRSMSSRYLWRLRRPLLSVHPCKHKPWLGSSVLPYTASGFSFKPIWGGGAQSAGSGSTSSRDVDIFFVELRAQAHLYL